MEKYLAISLTGHKRRRIVSLGQFRPEKNHRLQLAVLKRVLELDARYRDVVLVRS